MQSNLSEQLELGDNTTNSPDTAVVDAKEPTISLVSNHNNTNNNTWSTYKLMTWNLWCMPVSSPRCLSNPDRCSTYLHDLAKKQEWQNYDGLIVVAIQELWCWKTGIFPPFLIRIIAYFEYIPYIGRFFAAFFTILSILFGVLPILKCLPVRYNPKARFSHKMRNYLPFAMNNNNIPITKFMCNGLTTLCNKKATQWGFQPYINDACNDSLSNKGWLWCYFEKQKFMLINTHMQAAGAGHERLLQIKELKLWLYTNWESKELINKCIILGDFNVDMESHPQRVEIYNNGLGHGGDEEREKKYDEKDDIISVQWKINRDIDEELGDDPLTCIACQGKESYADNLRKLKLANESGKLKKRIRKVKLTKKAYINIPHHLGPKYHKLNRYEPTFKRAQYNIDHIFANFQCKQIKNNLLALGRYKLSDHTLVVSEFVTE